MLGNADPKPNRRQINDRSGEQDRMISFDASRISPNHHGGLNLDTSHANMNSTMLGHLDNSNNKQWPAGTNAEEEGRRDDADRLPAVEGDLTDPMEEQLIKPE